MKKILLSYVTALLLTMIISPLNIFASEGDFTVVEYTYNAVDSSEPVVGLEVTAYNGGDTDIY